MTLFLLWWFSISFAATFGWVAHAMMSRAS